jgi:hypothetical protein
MDDVMDANALLQEPRRKPVAARRLYGRRFFEGQSDGSLTAARHVIPVLLESMQPASVVDIGCGVGTWLKAFQEAGVSDFVGIDGNYVDLSQLVIPRRHFVAHDLNERISFPRRYDLAISLEVAEHLAPERGQPFVEDLCRCADVVLFSAAIPFQGGIGHLNEQWQDYWIKIFTAQGYAACDAIRPRLWNNQAIDVWYRQNSIVFANPAGISRWPRLAVTQPIFSLVHPEMFVDRASPDRVDLRRLGLWRVVRQLPRLIAKSLAGAVGRLV